MPMICWEIFSVSFVSESEAENIQLITCIWFQNGESQPHLKAIHFEKRKLELIQKKIYTIREHQLMLNFELAELFGTETKYLKIVVRTNAKSFLRILCLSENELGLRNR
jgi:hypothetical protein